MAMAMALLFIWVMKRVYACIKCERLDTFPTSCDL